MHSAAEADVASGTVADRVTPGNISEPVPGAEDIPAQTEIRSGRENVSEPHPSHNDGRCEAILTHSARELFSDAQAFDTVVQMRNINIAYGQRQIFKDLNWTVHSGEKWNVSGPNGSGKSTLLSLVNADNPKAYSLDITDTDPIKYGLIFERFLNPERISMPYIDIDFADNRRGEVIDYVIEKYGTERVSQIVTFGTMIKMFLMEYRV